MRRILTILTTALLLMLGGIVVAPTAQAYSGTFMSATRWPCGTHISGTSLVVANKSFKDCSGVALTVENTTNVDLTNLDFDNVVGGIFLINVKGTIHIEGIRGHAVGDGTIGSGHSNLIQFNNSWQGALGGVNQSNSYALIRSIKLYGGHTEDAISVYKSGGVDAQHPMVLGDIHVEHPLPPDGLAWTSGSGTCINLADAGGHDIRLQNSTFLNCGAVGIQMNEPTRVRVTRNIVYGEARSLSNVGLSQWSGTSCSTCTGNQYDNNRVWWVKPDGSSSAMWLSKKYPVADINNVKMDTTINKANLHVVL